MSPILTDEQRPVGGAWPAAEKHRLAPRRKRKFFGLRFLERQLFGLRRPAARDHPLAPGDDRADGQANADAEEIGVARDLCVMPLMYYSYHNLVSAKVGGWQENVMDIHPSRFLTLK